jgi:hypothetical protein
MNPYIEYRPAGKPAICKSGGQAGIAEPAWFNMRRGLSEDRA